MTMTDAARPPPWPQGCDRRRHRARRRPRARGLLPLPPVLGPRAGGRSARSRTSGTCSSRVTCRRSHAATSTRPASRRRGTCRPRCSTCSRRWWARGRRRWRRCAPRSHSFAAVEAMPPTYDADPETIRDRCDATVCGDAGARRRPCTGRRSARRPIAPRDDLGSAANYLYMIDGEVPEPARARAIEQYLILAIDHGFNASTFTGARRDVDRCRRRCRGRRRARRAVRIRCTAARRVARSTRSTPSARPSTPRHGYGERSPVAIASWASVTRCTARPIRAR